MVLRVGSLALAAGFDRHESPRLSLWRFEGRRDPDLATNGLTGPFAEHELRPRELGTVTIEAGYLWPPSYTPGTLAVWPFVFSR